MDEKPREKFLRLKDAKKMSTEELFSIILGHGSSSSNVYDLSSQISTFLRNKPIGTITIADLKKFDGIGEVKAMQILSALELGRRYFGRSKKLGLAEMDWDFADLKQTDRQRGVHFFHHYTAKFIPQIPARIIKYYAHRESVIVDPFMGSGTTLVEANIQGCHSIGLDTNPLAVKISKAKTMRLTKLLLDEIDDFISWLTNDHGIHCNLGDVSMVDLYPDSNEWFRADVLQKIASILTVIRSYSPEVRNFLEVGLSNLLKGMSNARMDSVTPTLPRSPIYIDRKHYNREVNNHTREIPVFERMLSQVRRMRAAILDFNNGIDKTTLCKPIMGDARNLSSFVDHCDLVITSPPYWSAQNYNNIHKLSMSLFGMETENDQEIGQNGKQYLDDMNLVIKEIGKILKGHFVIVIGHDENKFTHEKLHQMIVANGFIPLEIIIRKISNQVSRAKQIKNEYIYIFEN